MYNVKYKADYDIFNTGSGEWAITVTETYSVEDAQTMVTGRQAITTTELLLHLDNEETRSLFVGELNASNGSLVTTTTTLFEFISL